MFYVFTSSRMTKYLQNYPFPERRIAHQTCAWNWPLCAFSCLFCCFPPGYSNTQPFAECQVIVTSMSLNSMFSKARCGCHLPRFRMPCIALYTCKSSFSRPLHLQFCVFFFLFFLWASCVYRCPSAFVVLCSRIMPRLLDFLLRHFRSCSLLLLQAVRSF